MTSQMRRGTVLRCVSLVVLGFLALAGCDRSPSGEGDWHVLIQGPGAPFGAAAIAVSGDGVLGIASHRGTEVWQEELEPGEFRAVVIQPASSGDLWFRIRVRELRDPPPSIAIVELADMDDEVVTVSPEHSLRLRN